MPQTTEQKWYGIPKREFVNSMVQKCKNGRGTVCDLGTQLCSVDRGVHNDTCTQAGKYHSRERWRRRLNVANAVLTTLALRTPSHLFYIMLRSCREWRVPPLRDIVLNPVWIEFFDFILRRQECDGTDFPFKPRWPQPRNHKYCPHHR